MKVEICSFSGYRIYPGHGKKMVKADGKTFVFLNAKCAASHKMKRNPRKIRWTVLYRRKHKKGLEEETTKKRTRRAAKFQRAIVGASLSDILAKRNMKPEVAKVSQKQKAAKPVQTKAPRIGGKR
ncbi:60S ribosomal protein L24 [Nephila pilipes]|uniref:Large ribosomal subunit protein eL24 n=1 Tax=Nephila pilipes TaxID=299642 RepID=A0A8X6PI34_NEPPI|nr:60S ribosomal protein L24 [Nephila pilipes]